MSQDSDPVDVAAALMVSIGVFRRRIRNASAEGGLTSPELSALGRLEQVGPATPSELARAERISPQAMGTTVNSLEQRGLIERRPDPADGRRTVMSLTEAGRHMTRNKRTARTEQLAKILSTRFTSEELAVLLAAAPLIERLAEGIE